MDDNLIITHGRGHLAFWHRRKDGFFERTDIVKQPSRSHVTSVQFEPDGDVITADSDGFITIYSVDSDGAYFVRTEFEAHTKGIGCLIMLGEGTLLSGGEKDRKIAAWDSLQNYKKIADTKVSRIYSKLILNDKIIICYSYPNPLAEYVPFILNAPAVMMVIFMSALLAIIFWRVLCKDVLPR